MEIKNSLLKNIDPYRARLNPKTEAVTAKSGSSAPELTAVPTGDRVSLSPDARLMNAAGAEIGKTPDIRQTKIDGIKERLSAGEYVIDAKEIAKKLLENEKALAAVLKL